ncbi:MAG: hypothetical protein JSS49_13500 [Planctomycetes bacterium]|nr:hypothetical protein [Planctomycetota bacterium]
MQLTRHRGFFHRRQPQLSVRIPATTDRTRFRDRGSPFSFRSQKSGADSMWLGLNDPQLNIRINLVRLNKQSGRWTLGKNPFAGHAWAEQMQTKSPNLDYLFFKKIVPKIHSTAVFGYVFCPQCSPPGSR